MNAEDFNDNSSADKFLVYQLGAEYFATALIEIRGVVEFHAAKPIPHTVPYYKGVINIRGEIIGVIDLRERLGLHGTDTPACQLIFESEAGPLAASVDKVISVSVLSEADIDRKASTEASEGERPYFQGVAKLDGKILTLVSLRQIAGFTVRS
jgi:purine-binding chemotaxis protein CheW